MSTNGGDNAFAQLVEALEHKSDGPAGSTSTGNGGRRGNGGNCGNGDGDGRDDGLGPFERLLLDALRRMGHMQSEFTLKTAEAAIAGLMEAIKQVADQAAQQDLVVAKELGETLTRSLRSNADLAEHTAALAERVAALEARLRPATAGASEDGLP